MNILDHLAPEPEPSTSWIEAMSILGGLPGLTTPAVSLSPAPIDMKPSDAIRAPLIDNGVDLRSTIVLTGFYTRQGFDRPLRRVSSTIRNEKSLVFLTTFCAARSDDCQALQYRWQVELFFKWIKQHLRIKAFFGTSETRLRRKSGRRSASMCWSPSSKNASPSKPLRNATDFEPHSFRENPAFTALFRHPSTDVLGGQRQPIELIQFNIA